MDKEDKKNLGKSMAKAVSDNAEELLKEIPVVGKVVSKVVKTVRQGVSEYQKEKAEEEPYPPLYMDCATFYCKEGYRLSEGQQELLTEIAIGNYEGDNAEALEIVMEFIVGYTDINPSDDDFLSEDYGGVNVGDVWFNFQEGNEFRYDEEVLKNVMEAFNSLLEVSIFDRFDVAGHNESNDLGDYDEEDET